MELDKEQLRALKAGIPVTLEFFYTEQPMRSWYQMRLYPFSEGVCIFISDICNRKQTEEALAEHVRRLDYANKELASFSYSVSHDLGNPLNNIAAMIDLLGHRCNESLDNEAKGYIGFIKNNVEHMAQLIFDLLALSSVGRQSISVGEFDFGAMVHGCVKALREEQPEREVKVVIPSNVPMMADKKLMKIVLNNILGNAWKYTSRKKHPRIEIGVQEGESETVFFVKNNGAGFDTEQAQRCFVPFLRLHSRKEFPGTGVGLSIVERIIRRHNGRIWAEGKPGRGAAFYFLLGDVPGGCEQSL